MASLSAFLKRRQTPLILTALALMAFAATLPLMRVGWADTHENLRFIALHEQFKEAFLHGIAYPRWMPFLYGGYGYPTFLFYQPGFFFLSLVLDLLLPDTLLAIQLAVLLMFLIGGTGMFLLARERGCPPALALFCGLWFMLTPYLFVNVYVRGALSEFLSVVLTPWPLYAVCRLHRATSGRTATWPWLGLTALTLAAIVLAHPFTAMFYYPVFCVLAVAWAAWDDRVRCRRQLMLAGAAVVLAVILCSPYWQPAAQLKEQVQYRPAIDMPYNWISTHVVYPRQLLTRTWEFGTSVRGAGDTMSFQLGLAHFLLALAGVALGVRRQRVFLLYGGIYAALIFMTHQASLPIWNHVPGLRYAQFPWRILSVVAVVQCLCASGIGTWTGTLRPSRLAAALSAILLLSILWHRHQFQAMPHADAANLRPLIAGFDEARKNTVFTYANVNEFLPVTVRLAMAQARGNAPLISVDHLDCLIEEMPDSDAYRIHFRIAPARPLRLIVNQLYFPGWCVLLDGQRIPDAELRRHVLSDGRMLIPIAPGDHELIAWYDGPPGWGWRNAVIALALLAYLGLVRREIRQGKTSGPPPQDGAAAALEPSDPPLTAPGT
jgi:hypothetical protein